MQDRELTDLIGKDAEAGMKQLMKQYSGFVYTIVYSKLCRVCTKEDAEECAADVFIEFYRSISSFDLSRGTVRGFLSIIARRVAIARFHTLTKNRPEIVSTDDGENPVDELRAEEDGIGSGQRRLLLDAVNSLGEPDSTLIMKKYFGGETARQIASELGMNGFTVDKRIRRALVKLRKKLTEGGYYE